MSLFWVCKEVNRKLDKLEKELNNRMDTLQQQFDAKEAVLETEVADNKAAVEALVALNAKDDAALALLTDEVAKLKAAVPETQTVDFSKLDAAVANLKANNAEAQSVVVPKPVGS